MNCLAGDHACMLHIQFFSQVSLVQRRTICEWGLLLGALVSVNIHRSRGKQVKNSAAYMGRPGI
ncbi:hypothetical protein NC653_007245 [Populus alba x Populus x berolinensis]|uniref:Uncharacterized protein n=1 Tax=Populus alba x Populus x berolinensis TaxID=444605 RepID=A0AAD6WD84_9ROSI|nr:hypothetical protein NC653_007245 [Populus alba x Populus x berolinensis]